MTNNEDSMEYRECDLMIQLGVGHDLRRLRQRAGMTQARLAALAACSLTTIQNIEAGAVPRQSAALDRINRVLKDAKRAGCPMPKSPLQRGAEGFEPLDDRLREFVEWLADLDTPAALGVRSRVRLAEIIQRAKAVLAEGAEPPRSASS